MHIPDLLVRALIYSSWEPYHHRPTTTVTIDITETLTRTPTVTGTTTTVTTSTTTTTRSSTSSNPSTMPSLTTTLLTTSLLTLTSVVPTTTGQSIVGPIEGLPQCDQTIIFERLANSQCNPANFPCICDELARQQVGEAIRQACSDKDFRAYERFRDNICANNRRPTNPPVTINTTTTTIPVIPITTGAPSNLTTTTRGPFNNVTVTLSTGGGGGGGGGAVTTTRGGGGGGGGGGRFTTSEILIPTTLPNGRPTTLVSSTVLPVAPTGPPPGGEFTGEAAELFGVRGAFVLGGMGLMGLVFAEL